MINVPFVLWFLKAEKRDFVHGCDATDRQKKEQMPGSQKNTL